jgi:phosphate transport system protein
MMSQYEVEDVKRPLSLMMGNIETALKGLESYLKSQNSEELKGLHELENKVNQFHLEIDDRCYKVLALKHPMGRQLRRVVAWIRSNNDLERMGDEVMNVVNALNRPGGVSAEAFKVLSNELNLLMSMTKDSFWSLSEENLKKIRKVFEDEKRLNELNNYMAKWSIEKAKSGDETVEKAFNAMVVSRCLERMGDHATNIAENVVFIESGEDVRHPSKELIKDLEGGVFES